MYWPRTTGLCAEVAALPQIELISSGAVRYADLNAVLQAAAPIIDVWPLTGAGGGQA